MCGCVCVYVYVCISIINNVYACNINHIIFTELDIGMNAHMYTHHTYTHTHPCACVYACDYI